MLENSSSSKQIICLQHNMEGQTDGRTYYLSVLLSFFLSRYFNKYRKKIKNNNENNFTMTCNLSFCCFSDVEVVEIAVYVSFLKSHAFCGRLVIEITLTSLIFFSWVL